MTATAPKPPLLKTIQTTLPGCIVIEPQVFGDARGFFYESFHAEKYKSIGLDLRFVQTNVSRSARGVLRGLHYQWPNPQGKLVSVLEGEVFDVAVDIRPGSPTFAQWTGVMLTDENKRHFWIPKGFAHGFAVVSEHATFMYQCTEVYNVANDAAIAWNDAISQSTGRSRSRRYRIKMRARRALPSSRRTVCRNFPPACKESQHCWTCRFNMCGRFGPTWGRWARLAFFATLIRGESNEIFIDDRVRCGCVDAVCRARGRQCCAGRFRAAYAVRRCGSFPRGDTLAALAIVKGRQVLSLIHLGDNKGVLIAPREGSEVVGFSWASADRVIYSIGEHTGGQDAPVVNGELYTVKSDGGEGR